MEANVLILTYKAAEIFPVPTPDCYYGVLSVQFSLPVHSSSIAMECRVPLDRQELHPADSVVIHSFLIVAVQQLERHATEVIHWKHKNIYKSWLRGASTKCRGEHLPHSTMLLNLRSHTGPIPWTMNTRWSTVESSPSKDANHFTEFITSNPWI